MRRKIPLVALNEDFGHVSREDAGAMVEQAIRENTAPDKSERFIQAFQQLNEYMLGDGCLCDQHLRFFDDRDIARYGSMWLEKVIAGELPLTEKIGEFIEKKCFGELKEISPN